MSLELVLLILFLVLAISIISRTLNHDLLPPSPLALPIIGHLHLLSPVTHRSFQNLALRFGPLFSLRLGSVSCIVVTSPELAKEFLKTNEHAFINRPQSIAINRITYNASFVFSPYGPYWKFIRKLSMEELLSSRSVDKFLSIRNQECLRLLRLLAKKAENYEAANLSEELRRLGYNVMGKMMLGKHSSDSFWAEEARLLVREATKMLGELNLCDFNWVWKKLDLQGFGNKIENTHKRVDNWLDKIIAEREELRKERKKTNGGGNVEEEEVKDFLDILLDLLDDESREIVELGFSRVHIKTLIGEFSAAGIDPIAISMEWALAELINHPKVLKKAREEINQVVKSERLVGESDGPNLPYIQAIIKETYRLHPPLSLLRRRSTEQCQIGRYVIPENTLIFVNNWAIGRDPKYWENPLNFWPERFLQVDGRNGTSKLDVRGQHFEFIPFGSGMRICAGINLTMKMLPGLLAAMIQCFDWKVVGTDRKMNNNVLDMDEGRGLTTPRAHDLVCVPITQFSPPSIID
ncbi:licodione synthase-like [Rosa rugosa]|uniref:licodione synthase-like n=1 Tax=Rosa rugosa TaxID=74645 RepID=UPI002B40E0EF|nr:licodione synthase-like [Rosa rugosa]